MLFVIAGHETTTKMVANAVELLSRHPDQQALLAGEPERVATAVEEVLRFHNSTQYMHRTLTTDIERHGQTMRAGDSVLLLIGAANHDEREFGESDPGGDQKSQKIPNPPHPFTNYPDTQAGNTPRTTQHNKTQQDTARTT